MKKIFFLLLLILSAIPVSALATEKQPIYDATRGILGVSIPADIAETEDIAIKFATNQMNVWLKANPGKVASGYTIYVVDSRGQYISEMYIPKRKIRHSEDHGLKRRIVAILFRIE